MEVRLENATQLDEASGSRLNVEWLQQVFVLASHVESFAARRQDDRPRAVFQELANNSKCAGLRRKKGMIVEGRDANALWARLQTPKERKGANHHGRWSSQQSCTRIRQ